MTCLKSVSLLALLCSLGAATKSQPDSLIGSLRASAGTCSARERVQLGLIWDNERKSVCSLWSSNFMSLGYEMNKLVLVPLQEARSIFNKLSLDLFESARVDDIMADRAEAVNEQIEQAGLFDRTQSLRGASQAAQRLKLLEAATPDAANSELSAKAVDDSHIHLLLPTEVWIERSFGQRLIAEHSRALAKNIAQAQSNVQPVLQRLERIWVTAVQQQASKQNAAGSYFFCLDQDGSQSIPLSRSTRASDHQVVSSHISQIENALLLAKSEMDHYKSLQAMLHLLEKAKADISELSKKLREQTATIKLQEWQKLAEPATPASVEVKKVRLALLLRLKQMKQEWMTSLLGPFPIHFFDLAFFSKSRLSTRLKAWARSSQGKI